jgi:hypothetical protein
VPGGPASAFAAPECRRPFPQLTTEAERAKLAPAAARRLAGLVTAAWAVFDEVAAASPAEWFREAADAGIVLNAARRTGNCRPIQLRCDDTVVRFMQF